MLLKKSPSVISVFLACVPFSGQALEFNADAWEASLHTKLSYGAAWRIEDRDQRLLGQGNQNLSPGSNLGSPSNSTDDGNWNFDQYDTYSKILKGTSELHIGNGHFGLVSSARYFYDFELKDESRAQDDTGYARQLSDRTLDTSGADIDLLNAYIYGHFDFGRPATLKLGRHTLSWGEGVFMQGGVNAINPIDLSAARVPGAELKDILLPTNMVSGVFELSDESSLEVFYQLEWEAMELDPCGTFFSTNDTIAKGCGPIILLNVPDANNQALIASQSGIIPRLEDKQASDSSQFGLAMHWLLESGSELGVYYMQYHSRLPYFSGYVLDYNQVTPNDQLPIPGLPSYFSEYPEHIRLFGLSYSGTNDKGYTLSAEYSFRPNLPIQWNSTEVIYGGLLRLHSRHLTQRANEANIEPYQLAGTRLNGYDRFEVSQLQLSTTKLLNDILGANQALFVAEAGAVYISNFTSLDQARYGRAADFSNGSFNGLGNTTIPDINPFSPLNPNAYSCTGEGAAIRVNDNPSYCDDMGYTNQFSWGYILAMQLDYQAAFSNINIQPEVYFSHDVNGTAPDPMGLFVEGRKSLGLTLKADYQLNRYQAAINYLRYFGGGRHNTLNDRDHISASISVSF